MKTINLKNECKKLFALFIWFLLSGLPSNKLFAQAPILGTYPSTTIVAGRNTEVNPSIAPVNTLKMMAYANTSFTGVLSVNPGTGVVTVTNAKQEGVYVIIVKAFNGTITDTTTFILTVTDPNCSNGLFTSAANVPLLSHPYSVAIGDFNKDGNQDIIYSIPDLGQVSIRMGNGIGDFSGITNITVGSSPRWVSIGDLNGDGYDDIAVANVNSNNVSIKLGDGSGNFSGSTTVTVGANPYCVALGDFNGDGHKDLAVANTASNNVSIRLGNGNGVFTGSTQVSCGSLPFVVTIGDFNNDGKNDLAIANGGSNSVSIRIGDGTGNFSGTFNYPVGAGCTNVQIGDFDADGNQDLVATNQNSNNISILNGLGNGTFIVSATIAVGSQPWSSAVGDFNGDGIQDIVTANYGGNVSEFLGDGLGGFNPGTNITLAGNPYSVAVGDFNNDNRQDLAIANFGANYVAVRLGIGITPSVTTINSQCSYTWVCNNVNYTSSGVYTCTHMTAGGCVIVDTLNLTIIPGTLTVTSGTGCGSYTWACNNMTYTVSGVYDCLVGQCDTIRLNLTIHPVVDIDVTPFSPNNCANVLGGFTFVPNGGTPPFQINVSPSFAYYVNVGQSGISVNNFSAGTYTIVITDANGCSNSSVSTIALPPPGPILTANTIPLCMLGAFALDANGGTSPYNYEINGLHSQTYSGITTGIGTDPIFPNGEYTITVCDANGCCNSTVLILTNVPPCARNTNIIINTGYDPTLPGVLIQDSLADSRWTVSALEPHVHGGSYNQFAFYSPAITTSNTAWATNLLSHAISNTHPSNNGQGDLTFRRTFSTCESDWFTFNLCAIYDNGINGIRIDGILVTSPNTINNTVSFSQFNTFHCYSFIRFLNPGLHTIDINVYNEPGMSSHGLNLYGNIIGTLNSLVTDVSPLNCCCTPVGLTVTAKVLLSGPYDEAQGLMHDSLRVCGVLPVAEPYTTVPYNKPVLSEPGGETTTQAILSVAGPSAIVDWIFLELRNGAPAYDIVATRRALIRRNGDIVDVDGISPVSFPFTSQGDYFVCVKHRNHLGVMTATSVSLYNGSPAIDFTGGTVWNKPSLMPIPPYNTQRRMQGGKYTLWAGDANNNKNVKYNGLSNDKDKVLFALGTSSPNNIMNCVYRMEDVNMDNKIKYNGFKNDREVIINNILNCPENISHTPNYVLFQHTPN